MSRFFVGQRVRIIGCDDPEDLEAMALIGSEATVRALDIFNELDEPGNIGVIVGNEDDWCFLPHELEPATFANEKISWEECAWCPEHLRETV